MRQPSESAAGSLTLTIGSVGGLLKEALHETVHTVGLPEAAPEAMLFGHVQVPLQ
jgi:Phosphogluconate dehydrogenase (decarboxylating) C-term